MMRRDCSACTHRLTCPPRPCPAPGIQEACRLQGLRHPHVITFFGVSWDEPTSTGIILTEFAAGRDLQSVLGLRSARTGQRVFGWWRSGRRIAAEVARALAYLHAMGVVHMDGAPLPGYRGCAVAAGAAAEPPPTLGRRRFPVHPVPLLLDSASRLL